ncbi:hypothetical protein CANTEDRAFT_114005 [Yamadazyma tenuis ATCC 10573]|uniref:Nodulin-like domain-containing protein n=1 Tax=Candida tenuis (strain ATCC 10573 / BCRC 21748 / CBS 615 / JCM 9827 / NBRC 10315 / NRRL Y-1498 / VKM Y-70) TaxID=590646 RepID=G3B4K7_CANTC|nr:uncharacterized protein CANTEDRAFT_114005 [Yamadazyma tenuis ATCC 10573]EGV63969.1 hypothetical protein CANTEDRAFT_114005 [Yamadazyma tenuis ATCC 10573]
MVSSTVRKSFVLLSCTFLGLICGTMYLYSSYSPQFAAQLGYSVTDSSKIALAGTIGVAIAGPISGKVVDRSGYSWAMIIGGVFIFSGYLGLKKQFDIIYSSLPVSNLLLFMVGMGSTFINSACLKCCAVSFPSIRGVATSLPLALYGLSALFYSVIGSVFFPGDTSRFLGFLAYSSMAIFCLCSPSVFMADGEHSSRGVVHRKTISASGIEMSILRSPVLGHSPGSPAVGLASPIALPKASGSGTLIDEVESGSIFASSKFWILFFLTGFLAAMGQMYIYSVGYIVKALVTAGITFDSTISEEARAHLEALIQKNQQLHVGLLSATNCIGRLVSGICGDIISQSFHKRRSWLLFVPAIGLTITQIMGYQIEDYTKLTWMSLLTGFFYGFTFCLMPIIIGDFFGMDNFSSNWGFVGLAPILPSFYFTKLFGNIFDSNSFIASDGSHICSSGSGCYKSIFRLDMVVTVLCVVVVGVLNFGFRWLSKSPREYKPL